MTTPAWSHALRQLTTNPLPCVNCIHAEPAQCWRRYPSCGNIHTQTGRCQFSRRLCRIIFSVHECHKWFLQYKYCPPATSVKVFFFSLNFRHSLQLCNSPRSLSQPPSLPLLPPPTSPSPPMLLSPTTPPTAHTQPLSLLTTRPSPSLRLPP